jgi:hypothetical protein
MSAKPPAWQGYIELPRSEGLVTCEIVPDAAGADDPYVGVWIGGNLADDIEGRDELVATYGDRFFASLADYKADNDLTIDDVWPI